MEKKLGSYEENHAMFNKVFIKGSRSQISINSESMKPTRPEKGLYTTYKLVQYCAKTFEPQLEYDDDILQFSSKFECEIEAYIHKGGKRCTIIAKDCNWFSF